MGEPLATRRIGDHKVLLEGELWKRGVASHTRPCVECKEAIPAGEERYLPLWRSCRVRLGRGARLCTRCVAGRLARAAAGAREAALRPEVQAP